MDRRSFLWGIAGSGLSATLTGCSLSRWISDSSGADGGTLRALRVDHDACIGCFHCEDVCREVNHLDEPTDSGSSGPTDRSLIHLLSFMPGPFHVVWACLGCPDVPCVRACDYYASPLDHRKALHIHPETGAISLERDWCAGCERCIEACSRDGGNVLRWDDREYVTGACHLCEGDPACAQVCPVNAITMITVDRTSDLTLRSPEAVAREGIARRLGRQVEPVPIAMSDGPIRALRVQHERCTGCRLCEAACGERNSPLEVDGRVLPGLGDMTASLIRVHRFDGPFYVAWSCLGCPDLPCVTSCEAEAFGAGQARALDLDPDTGAIRLAGEFCTGCQKCIDACHDQGGDVLSWDPELQVVGACHLCGGEPACIPACPFDAIELVTIDRTQPLEPRRVAEIARLGAERAYRRREDGA
jgi:Fe-S-cluster-containing dehydrogenase component